MNRPLAMDENERYFTPVAPARCELIVKKSRFIAVLHPAADKADVDRLLDHVRAEFADARHHCFAWSLGSGAGRVYRADDAGEPAGSAGKPILQALETRQVSDAVLVVTRYFGGIKLGIGGLIRAYGQAAFDVIDLATLREVSPVIPMKITFDYDVTGAVRQVLNRLGAEVVQTDFTEKTIMHVTIPAAQAAPLKQALTDATRGEIEFR